MYEHSGNQVYIRTQYVITLQEEPQSRI